MFTRSFALFFVASVLGLVSSSTATASVNPFYLYDVNADGFVTDADPLAVINHLNSGDPYDLFLDVNLDGFNSPIDALILINFLNSNPWQNPGDAFDVNGDGFVSPIDVLLVINELNANGPGPFTLAEACTTPYLDADGDNELTSNDATVIIDFLNSP